MATVNSLISRVKAILTTPEQDSYFDSNDIIDWMHEGALEIFPNLPEEVLTSHITSGSYMGVTPLLGCKIGTITLPEALMRLKTVEVQKTTNNWVYSQTLDYSRFRAKVTRYNDASISSPLDYYNARTGSIVHIFPLSGSTNIRIYYYAYPSKITTVTLAADYPTAIHSAIIDYAIARGKTTDNQPSVAAEYYIKFNNFIASLKIGYQFTPPSTGITPSDRERLK